ncbi:MAG: DNA polymerase III subunit gamma/tau [Acidobacteriia bacterium]|nr:DNA polymerase III subunit gamma/tau [Terriglobia bacterium]
MYQVIARKYRPQTFADVVSQEHVKTTLENAIAQQRIAHGYIFSGQRGTGKTTIARILARCVNCVQGPTATPDGTCASCIEIAQGNAPDVIEIDAASNRGINEMRELRENVRYRPVRDRYKVFIIDEAHQITSEAFNALLKTIEEPPSWVIFILCTTEAHKIPATIASRCQHFSFRSVDFDEVVTRMEWICRQEGIEADAEVLSVLAQAGEGSIRDSLSALDQAIACCGIKLDAKEVRALLGAFSMEALEAVTQALASSDSRRMLTLVDELERNGHNLQHFSRELARYFRNLLVSRIAGSDTRLIAASANERARFVEMSASFSEEDLTRYLQLSLDLFKDLQFSLQPRFHLEIGLVKLVQAGRLTSIEEALAGLKADGETGRRGDGETKADARMEHGPSAATRGRPGEARVSGGDTAPRPTTSQNPSPSRPSPFELDRAKKATRPEPQSIGATALAPEPAAAPAGAIEWREKLHAALMELEMPFTADALEHSRVTEAGNVLEFVTPKEFMLAMRAEDISKAVQRISSQPFKIKVAAREVAPAETGAVADRKKDDASQRALANPEVQRFREVFGGEVRAVRDLKKVE